MLIHGAMQGCGLTSWVVCFNDKFCDIRERNVAIRSENWTRNICSLGFRDIREWVTLWGLILRSLWCTSPDLAQNVLNDRLWAPLLYIMLITYWLSRQVGGWGDEDSTVPPADAALAETADAKRDVTQTNGRGRHQLPERRGGTVVCPGSWFAIAGAPAQAVAWAITPHSVAPRINRSLPLPSSPVFKRPIIDSAPEHRSPDVYFAQKQPRIASDRGISPPLFRELFLCSIPNSSPPDASRKNFNSNWQGSEFRWSQQGRREIGFGANEVELGQCLPHCRVIERLWSERKRSVVEKFIISVKLGFEQN